MTRDLDLGREVVQRLLPHRPPILMIDGVASYERAPRATLRAWRRIATDEPVFAGHFPDAPVWPGCYTLEGLAQTCALAGAIQAIERAFVARGRDPDRALDVLSGAGTDLDAEILASLAPRPGLLAAADVRFVEPVRPGARLDYVATEALTQGHVMRFEVEALVERRPVARGALIVTGAPPWRR